MVAKIQIDTADAVPDGARVGHYDELDEQAKEQFPALADADGTANVDPETESELANYDLVKFTDYYRVRRVN